MMGVGGWARGLAVGDEPSGVGHGASRGKRWHRQGSTFKQPVVLGWKRLRSPWIQDLRWALFVFYSVLA